VVLPADMAIKPLRIHNFIYNTNKRFGMKPVLSITTDPHEGSGM